MSCSAPCACTCCRGAAVAKPSTPQPFAHRRAHPQHSLAASRGAASGGRIHSHETLVRWAARQLVFASPVVLAARHAGHVQVLRRGTNLLFGHAHPVVGGRRRSVAVEVLVDGLQVSSMHQGPKFHHASASSADGFHHAPVCSRNTRGWVACGKASNICGVAAVSIGWSGRHQDQTRPAVVFFSADAHVPPHPLRQMGR